MHWFYCVIYVDGITSIVGYEETILSVSVTIIANSNPHKPWKMIFKYGNLCIVSRVDVAFGHICSAFGQSIVIILAHYPICNLLQIQCACSLYITYANCINYSIIDCLIPEVNTITPDMTQI